MTKKQANEELAGQYIDLILNYGERVLPETADHLKRLEEALNALGIFKVYGKLRTAIREERSAVLEYEAEAEAQV